VDRIFFDSWQVLIRTASIGVLAYAGLVFFLRLSGKRTLSKMNAFDLVVTVALGSTLASILVSRDVALAQGALALSLLIGLQFVITWTSVRARWLRGVVTGEPALLVYDGRYLVDALRRERITESEVRAAIRSAGLAAVEDARAVVLETDGSLSVVRGDRSPSVSSLADLELPRADR
jgi:uncharacterized membrane protein YcaP (DUF421 family)